jgi:DNA-binding CsgD family transcriptional regulator
MECRRVLSGLAPEPIHFTQVESIDLTGCPGGAVAGSQSASSSTRALLCPTVIGRDRERGTIKAALDDARAGRGRALFLVGEAGIGKSRLAREAATAAEDAGMIVLRGRAVQSASPIPYRPLAEALCAGVRTAGPPENPELLPFRPALGRLVPEWRDERIEGADDSVVVLGEAILRFLRIMSVERGCLVVLEDLHWADPESLMILEYLVDNLALEPVLCVATLRIEEETPALRLARQLEDRRACPVFELARLGETEVAQMVTACLEAADSSRDVVALASRADGIPFLVEELLAATRSAGALVHDGHAWTLTADVDPVLPLTFADSVRRRLRPFDAEARRVLSAAAVIGRRFDWSLLPRVTTLSEAAVLDALHCAVDAQIIVDESGGDEFLFRHALTRDAVLADLLPPERAALAARALEAIETDHPGVPGPWCELAAQLAELAGNREHASRLLLEVGRRALAGSALMSSEIALDRALTLARFDDAAAVEIEESLTEVLSLAGKRDRAFEVSESLLHRLSKQSDAAAQRVEIHLRLARVAVAATDWRTAHDQLAHARADTAEIGDERLAARIEALSAHAAMGEHRPDEAAALATTAMVTANRVGLPEVACEALEIVGRCARPSDLDEAESAFARAYAIADENHLTVWRVRALHELGTIDLLRGGDIARLQEARDLAASIGALATVAVLDVQIAARLTAIADPDTTLEVAQRAAALARRYGLELTYAAARGFEGHAHAYARRRIEMEHCFADARAHAHGDPGIAVIILTGEAFFALAEEDRSEALGKFGDAAALSWQSRGDQSTGPSAGFFALVRALADPNRTDSLPEAPPWWHPAHFLAGASSRCAEAVVLGRMGRGREAAMLVEAADAQFARSQWHRQVARRLLAEAAIADKWGEPTAWLREALAFFEDQGNDRIASACRSLLRQAGAPVPRRRQGSETVPPSLRAMGVTARELEVLTLLADGLSNREIGERLYLSHRTVERHIANLTTKAGVERRSQLVAFAARAAADSA